MTLTLVVPDRSPLAPSGGDRYDAALVTQWRSLGREVRVIPVPGAWPWPTREELEGLHGLLGTLGEGPVLLDGLVGSAAPEAVERSATARPTVVLVHSLLADGAGATGASAADLDRRERRALAAAHAVVTNSGWARGLLAERLGIRDAAVAEPGTAPQAVASGSLDRTGTPVLLSLGAVVPLKNHAVLLAALERVADLAWSLVVAGPAPDPDHLAGLVGQAAERGLSDRVTWAGPLVGAPLEEVWDRTDLLLHPSRSETFGMVVAEAHAHGIPTLVGAGTGAVEALAGPAEHRDPAGGAGGLPGATVGTEGRDDLVAALRRWLAEPLVRRRWREAAIARRDLLGGWERTVEQIDEVLDRIST